MRRTTINLTEATDRQIEYLKERGYGSFTQIVRLAVDRMYRKEANSMAKCNHPKEARQFSEDGLLEFCRECGVVICDHHKRKFGKPHPVEYSFTELKPKWGKK